MISGELKFLNKVKPPLSLAASWLFIFQASAQTFTGQVLALPDSMPVPYASLTNQKHQWGVNASEDGTFEITQLKEGDTLLVSCLGYHESRIPFRELRDNSKLFLRMRPVQLAEAKVKSGGYKDIWLGSKQHSSTSSMGLLGATDMREAALLIPNPIIPNPERKEVYISTVGYYISKFQKPRTPFRVRIYSNEDGLPGEDLLKKSVVVHGNWGNSWRDVDVSKFNIPVPAQGVFVAMEWLVVPDKKYRFMVRHPDNSITYEFGQSVGTTDEFLPAYGRIRFLDGSWQAYRYGSRNNPRPMFRAQVRIYE